ncbi:FGFR1 oncoprotein partner, partial [Nowakowskiella sp. JEL0078]
MADLKSIVSDALAARGVLGKIKAELRASVFLVLQDAQTGTSTNLPLEQPRIRDFKQKTDGVLALELIRELLVHLNLENTLSVLVPEANLSEEPLFSRPSLVSKLNITNDDAGIPLLLQLVTTSTNTGSPMTDSSTPTELKPAGGGGAMALGFSWIGIGNVGGRTVANVEAKKDGILGQDHDEMRDFENSGRIRNVVKKEDTGELKERNMVE